MKISKSSNRAKTRAVARFRSATSPVSQITNNASSKACLRRTRMKASSHRSSHRKFWAMLRSIFPTDPSFNTGDFPDVGHDKHRPEHRLGQGQLQLTTSHCIDGGTMPQPPQVRRVGPHSPFRPESTELKLSNLPTTPTDHDFTGINIYRNLAGRFVATFHLIAIPRR